MLDEPTDGTHPVKPPPTAGVSTAGEHGHEPLGEPAADSIGENAGEPAADTAAPPLAELDGGSLVEPSVTLPSEEPPPASLEPEAEPAPAPPAQKLGDEALDRLFRTARTRWEWAHREVDDDTLRQLYELLRMGPTSANSCPARFMFLRTVDAKERLRPALSAGNVEKALAAPVVCIVAYDRQFYDELPRLYPEGDARAWFAGNEELAESTAFRNGTLQGAYLILAARALGLDCGPMSGFDNDAVDSEFLLATGWRSNFLVALGYADQSPLPPRDPRLDFYEACRLA